MLRSVVGVSYKGRTQPDSANGPRGGLWTMCQKHGPQICAEDCLSEAGTSARFSLVHCRDLVVGLSSFDLCLAQRHNQGFLQYSM